MMRFSVSTWNVLKMLGRWDEVRPFNFMFMVMTDHILSFDVDFESKPEKKPMVIVPFSSKQNEWNKLQGIDIRNKDRHGSYRRYRMDDPDFHPFTYGHMIEQYIRHPEAKSLEDLMESPAQQRLADCYSAHISLPDRFATLIKKRHPCGRMATISV